MAAILVTGRPRRVAPVGPEEAQPLHGRQSSIGRGRLPDPLVPFRTA